MRELVDSGVRRVLLALPRRVAQGSGWRFIPNRQWLEQADALCAEAWELGPHAWAIMDGRVVGVASILDDGTAPSVVVAESYRCRGIGSALLRSLELQCAEIGVEELWYPGADLYGRRPLDECSEVLFLLRCGWQLESARSRNAIKLLNAAVDR